MPFSLSKTHNIMGFEVVRLVKIALVYSVQFGFFCVTISSGGIAQLVERQLCKLDVRGSNPLASTSYKKVITLTENNSIKWACSSVG